MVGVECSTLQVHSMLYERGVGDFLFPIDLGGPLTTTPLPMLLLQALLSKQSIQ